MTIATTARTRKNKDNRKIKEITIEGEAEEKNNLWGEKKVRGRRMTEEKKEERRSTTTTATTEKKREKKKG